MGLRVTIIVSLEKAEGGKMTEVIGPQGFRSASEGYEELVRRFGLTPREAQSYFQEPSGYDQPMTGRFSVSASGVDAQLLGAKASGHAKLE